MTKTIEKDKEITETSTRDKNFPRTRKQIVLLSIALFSFGRLDGYYKVCILQPRSRLRSFDVPYIFYSKLSKSRARNLQTFQSGYPGSGNT